MERMHKKYRYVLVFFLVFVLCTGLSTNISTAAISGKSDGIKVILNNEQLEFDVQPYIKQGRTLVPFRKIFEAFGLDVQWNPSDKSVHATNGKDEIFLKINSLLAYVNKFQKDLDVPPEITDGRTFVPLRFVGESVGADVDWDGATRTINITYAKDKLKIGQSGAFGDLKFSIDAFDSDIENKKFMIKGKLSSQVNGYVYLIEDDKNYTYSNLTIKDQENGLYNFEADSFKDYPISKINFIELWIVKEDGTIKKIAEYTP